MAVGNDDLDDLPYKEPPLKWWDVVGKYHVRWLIEENLRDNEGIGKIQEIDPSMVVGTTIEGSHL